MAHPPLSQVKETPKCDQALGERMLAYNDLETVLDKWSPYL
jgi:hypothetical protein